jgi:large subunit ribosomal protein L37Ae
MTGGTKKVGSAGRFATRYGVKTRTQIAAIERKQKALHTCPSCGQLRVKRLGTGIWQCRRCRCVFAGGAYMPKAAPKQSLGAENAETELLGSKKMAKAPKKEIVAGAPAAKKVVRKKKVKEES